MGRKSIADIRREEFAVAAFEVLSLHGMQGTTLQRVAEHIGVSKASVLHYFSNKQNLIETALRRANAVLRQEAVIFLNLAESPWERFYAIVEANFSPTTFRSEVAHGWIAMCAEVPHNPQFQRLQAAIYRRLNTNLYSALKGTGVSGSEAQELAHTVSLLIDGLWLRCGLQIGGLNREEAIGQIEGVLALQFPDDTGRQSAKTKMRTMATAFSAGRA